MSKTSNKLPSGVWALGFVSLFTDISSEIVHGLLPVFLISTFAASVTSIGILEGLAEASVLVLKVFSGTLSDRFRKRKLFVTIGYSMGAISKPLIALAPNIALVYTARLFDRFGKGIRGAPRDALIADITPPSLRGRAFGLRQTLDTTGAFIGPILAILLMKIFNSNFRLIFWIATIPALISIATIIFGVKEDSNRTNALPVNRNIRFHDIKKFPHQFWVVVAFGALFQLARFSEAFLILRAKDFGLSLAFSPLVLIVMNIVYSLVSYPVGKLSDEIPRQRFLVYGLCLLCIADLVLGFSTNLTSVFIGIVFWGLHLGFTQGTLAALVADSCPAEWRGSAYGLFNLFSAGALLIASALAGILWDTQGAQITFFVSSGLSILSLLLLLIQSRLFKDQRNNKQNG